MTPTLIDALAEDAMQAFWAVVADRFPDASTGDLSIERTIALTITAQAAIREWVQNNVPTVQNGSSMPTATRNETDLDEMLTHLDSTHIVLEGFGYFVALSQDRTTIFACPMNADGSPERDIDDKPHLNWIEVTAPEPEFVEAVNAVFGTSFDWNRFAGR